MVAVTCSVVDGMEADEVDFKVLDAEGLDTEGRHVEVDFTAAATFTLVAFAELDTDPHSTAGVYTGIGMVTP
jgi:hypothetical protein